MKPSFAGVENIEEAIREYVDFRIELGYAEEEDRQFETELLRDQFADRAKQNSKAIEDINLKPTEAMANAAKRGLKLRKEHGRGGTEVGVARARDISNRKDLSPSTVKRMKSFFARHEVDLDAPAAKEGNEGYPSAGLIAWLLWGGDPGKTWAESKVEAIDRESGKKNLKSGDNCGTGAGGFKEDNTCATGSAAANRDFPRAADRQLFEKDLQRWKEEGGHELYGVSTELADERKYEQTKEDREALKTNRKLFKSEARILDEEAGSINLYTRHSATLNEALRNGTEEEIIPNPAKTYLGTEVETKAKEAVGKLRGELRDLMQDPERELASVANPFDTPEEFNAWRESWIEKNSETFEAIEAFGADLELAHSDMDDAYSAFMGHGTTQKLNDLWDTQGTLQDLNFALTQPDHFESFKQSFDEIDSMVNDWGPNEVHDAFYETGLAAMSNDMVRELDFDLNDSILKSGEPVLVHRGISLDKHTWEGDLLRNLLEKDEFTTRGYVSTSINASTASGFAGAGQASVHMRIKAKTGLDVAGYSAHPGEEEVLLPRDTTYRITNRQWKITPQLSKALLVIDAEEVE